MTATKWWWVVSFLVLCGVGGLWSLNEAVAGKPGGGPKTLPKVIAYLRSSNGVSDVRVMDANGGSSATIVRDVGHSGLPRWSPDGQRLLFDTLVNNEAALVSTKADGTDQQTIITIADLPFTGGSFTGYDWSPDGQWIVFASPYLYGGWGRNSRLFKVRIADDFLVQLTHEISAEDHFVPRWSSVLNTISYLCEHDQVAESREVWVMASDGTGRRRIADADPDAPIDYAPANWSNGGNPFTRESSLVYQRPGGVVILDINLSAVDPIVGSEFISVPNYQLQRPGWSPDDTQLLVNRYAPGIMQIATSDLLTGASKVLIQVNLSREGVIATDWRAAP
jgi:Tol biopolymer transport system component